MLRKDMSLKTHYIRWKRWKRSFGANRSFFYQIATFFGLTGVDFNAYFLPRYRG